MSRRHPDAAPPFRQPDRAPGERPRCRWCWQPVGKGRSSWCSVACVEEYRSLYDWQLIRGRVRDRDKGICALCGCDTDRLCRILRHADRFAWRIGESKDHRGVRLAIFETARGGYDLWEADHIVPREQGGTNAIENLRTLCVGCHHEVTSRQAGDRAASRRVRGRSLFG